MDEKIKKLEKELKYLTNTAIKEEIDANKQKLENNDINIKLLADEIYLKRGVDISKLNRNLTGNLINDLNSAFNGFKDKDKKIKNKMILDIVYLVILIILIKIPVDLVRDIGYDYIELLSTSSLYYNLWNLAFLVIYTILAICTFIVLIKNFNNKYVK